MRKLIAYFIKYHVAVNVFILAFLIFGIIGVLSLKSSFFPLVDSKIINVSITYPGASPQEIEEGIVLQIEDNLKGLRGIDRVTSVSRENSGTITVEIEKGENIDFMLLEVKNAVDRVPSFPTGMEPLIVAKREEVRETISFALSGDNIPLATLKQIGRQVENDLRRIDGISQISISGYPDEEIEIALQLIEKKRNYKEVAFVLNRTTSAVCNKVARLRTEGHFIVPSHKRSRVYDKHIRKPTAFTTPYSHELEEEAKKAKFMHNLLLKAEPFVYALGGVLILSLIMFIQ